MPSFKGIRPGWPVASVLSLIIAAAVWRTWDTGVNGDIMYVLGGLRAAQDGGVPFDQIFVARPFAYKCWIAGLDAVRSWFVDDPSSAGGMRAVRLTADVVVLLVSAALYAGLRRWVGRMPAACAAASAAVALIVSPRFNFLEPDWTAALMAVLAGGLMLSFKNEKIAWLLGGVVLWLTVAMKLSTAVFAAAAVLLVFALSRRRAVGGALAGAGITVVWFLLSRILQPVEWMWFADQAALVHDSPIHHAPRLSDAKSLVYALGNATAMSPIIVGSIGAATLFILRATTERGRYERTAIVVLTTGLAVASGFAQGEWFLYHFSDLAILAAVVWGLAVGLARGVERWILLIGPLLAGLVVAAVVPDYVPDLSTGALIVAIAGLCGIVPAALLVANSSAVLRPAGDHRRPMLAWPVIAVAAVALIAGMTTARPDVPLTLKGYDPKKAPPTTAAQAEQTLIRQEQFATDRLGPDTPVLYLAYGSTVFAFPNPTPCPYPSAQWLQRTMSSPDVHTFRSYEGNLACVTDKRAKFVVQGTSWFKTSEVRPDLRALVQREFDCSKAVRPAPPGLLVCPRR